MKVDFIIVGTQKGGTTALQKFLSLHPEIFMSSRKELHFFDKGDFCGWIDSEKSFEDYHLNFCPSSNHKIVGEATPSYMYWEKAPIRIQKYNAQMKMIFILRNPIVRKFLAKIMNR
jgi:hypothetical protein